MVIDELQFREGGTPVPRDEFLQAHTTLLSKEEWVIDGFGGIDAAWARFEVADTLVHVDLPLALHALGVTRRLLKGLFVAPEGWPKGSPIISSSLSSYRVLWPCHVRLTPRYRAYLSEASQRKRVAHLRSRRDMSQFLQTVRAEYAAR